MSFPVRFPQHLYHDYFRHHPIAPFLSADYELRKGTNGFDAKARSGISAVDAGAGACDEGWWESVPLVLPSAMDVPRAKTRAERVARVPLLAFLG
jgi:hypothetical protein